MKYLFLLALQWRSVELECSRYYCHLEHVETGNAGCVCEVLHCRQPLMRPAEHRCPGRCVAGVRRDGEHRDAASGEGDEGFLGQLRGLNIRRCEDGGV